MLTCHDVSAMMSGINLVQIRIILMNAAKTDRPYFDIRSLIRPSHLLLAAISSQSSMTEIYKQRLT